MNAREGNANGCITCAELLIIAYLPAVEIFLSPCIFHDKHIRDKQRHYYFFYEYLLLQEPRMFLVFHLGHVIVFNVDR